MSSNNAKEKRLKEFERDVATLFGENFDRLNEYETTAIYNKLRRRLRQFYLTSRATTFKVCDKCGATYPRLWEKCEDDQEDLRAFEVPFDDRFAGQIDIFEKYDVKP